ncbi:hypothetical protein D9M72_310620 [compost metagenome]
MMLSGISGRIPGSVTGVPAGASQAWYGWPASLPSSVTMGVAASWPRTGCSTSATVASVNRMRAPASATMPARLSGVDDGASGATTTPARTAPRYTAAYSIEDDAQMAMASPGRTPSRASAAAMRSMAASRPA